MILTQVLTSSPLTSSPLRSCPIFPRPSPEWPPSRVPTAALVPSADPLPAAYIPREEEEEEEAWEGEEEAEEEWPCRIWAAQRRPEW